MQTHLFFSKIQSTYRNINQLYSLHLPVLSLTIQILTLDYQNIIIPMYLMQPKFILLVRHGTLIYTTPLYFTARNVPMTVTTV
jgi:hypothetical protein